MAATHSAKMPPGLKHARRPRHFRRRSEPGMLPAAILTLVMHGAFFALIVFGISWQVRHPAPVSAELWSQLPPLRNPVPAPEPAPEPPPPPPPAPAKPVEKLPPPPSQADIALKAKREALAKKQAEQELLDKIDKKKRDEAKAREKKQQAEADKKRLEEEQKQKIAAENARREQAGKDSAARAVLDEAKRAYGDKIRALIRNRANIPDTVTGKPIIQLRLRLLVNGVIFDAQIVKPSGNRVYDEAVERAINGIRQWPLPDNPELFGGQRELTLNIEHEK